MRKLPAFILVALVMGAAVPAPAVEVEGPVALLARVVELWAKAGAALDPNGLTIGDVPAGHEGVAGAPDGNKAGSGLDPNGNTYRRVGGKGGGVSVRFRLAQTETAHRPAGMQAAARSAQARAGGERARDLPSAGSSKSAGLSKAFPHLDPGG